MSEIDYIHLYLFDIFNKNNEASDIIELLTRKYGQSKEQPGIITVIGSGKNVKETKHRWQLTNTNKILDEIEKTCKEKMESDMTLARSAIKEINIIGVQNDDLPYFVLVMSVSVDKTKLNFDKLFVDIEILLRPLRIYFEEFGGITRRLSRAKPICPFFVDIGILESKEKMKEILQISSEMLDAEGIFQESARIDYVISRSEKLRKIPPLDGMSHGFNLLSMPRMFSNSLSFVGHLEQPALNGLMTAFLITFASEKLWPNELPDPSILLAIRTSGYNGLITPGGNAGTIIYLLTMISWISYKELDVSKLGKELNQLRDKLRNLIESNKKIDLESHLVDFEKKGSKLASFISEIGQLIRNNESSIGDFVKGRTTTAVEIPVLPAKGDYWFWSTIKESTGSGAYLQSLAIRIEGSLHKIKNILDQYSYENEKLHNHVNNLVSIRFQNTMKKHSTMTLVSTGFIIGLTCVLAFFAYVQYNNENFTPEFPPAFGGDIIMQNNFLGNSDSSEGIKLMAKSNHDLRFTLTDATTYISSQGRCYFKSGPQIDLMRNDFVTWSVGDSFVKIVPELRIIYSPNPKFVIMGNSYNNNSTQYYVLGYVLFNFDVKDIQNGRTYHTTADSEIVVRLPPNKGDEFIC